MITNNKGKYRRFGGKKQTEEGHLRGEVCLGSLKRGFKDGE